MLSSLVSAMWATTVQPTCSNWEPEELRKLKHQLAHLSCKCKSCNISRASGLFSLTKNDKQVQVQQSLCSSTDQFTQANLETEITGQINFLNTVTKDVLCPGCFLTMNLLRGGGALRVLKDEESETKPEMFCCDKSTEKCDWAIDKSTSYTNKPMKKFSSLTFCDFTSEGSAGSSDSSVYAHEQKHNHQVKFVDTDGAVEKREVPYPEPCVCMNDFMDSIRPPLYSYSRYIVKCSEYRFC